MLEGIDYGMYYGVPYGYLFGIIPIEAMPRPRGILEISRKKEVRSVEAIQNILPIDMSQWYNPQGKRERPYLGRNIDLAA